MTSKSCFFAGCASTSISAPGKIFISVPPNEETRKEWFRSACNTTEFPKGTAIYCCQDHFKMEEDCENWQYHKMMGGYIRLKKGVLPQAHSAKPQQTQLKTTYTKKREAGGGKVLPEIEQMDKENKLPSPQHRNVRKKRRKGTQTPETILHSVATNTEWTLSCRPKLMPSKPILHSISDKTVSDPSSEFTSSASESGSTSCFEATAVENGEIEKIKRHSRLYTGIQKDSFIVDFLCSEGKLEERDALICLKKIRTNDSFKRLAIDFGVSPHYPSKIFLKTIPKIAGVLQNLIVWPSSDDIKRNLPQQFWGKFSGVQSIIDCFEVEIQKPSGALHQALTWSQYKNCNTAKYLISSTPSGLVNFVSCGFGGRTSDQEIVSESGYLDVLPENCQILADRGFKQIAHLIGRKSSTLLRPPSVQTGIKPTKEQVRQTKAIASLRIHIERVIRRLREFKMISPHACTSTHLLPFLDHIIIIACAIINLQGDIVKQ